jgi:hypothetical protein
VATLTAELEYEARQQALARADAYTDAVEPVCAGPRRARLKCCASCARC